MRSPIFRQLRRDEELRLYRWETIASLDILDKAKIEIQQFEAIEKDNCRAQNKKGTEGDQTFAVETARYHFENSINRADNEREGNYKNNVRPAEYDAQGGGKLQVSPTHAFAAGYEDKNSKKGGGERDGQGTI